MLNYQRVDDPKNVHPLKRWYISSPTFAGNRKGNTSKATGSSDLRRLWHCRYHHRLGHRSQFQSRAMASLTKPVNFRTHVKSCHPIIPGCLKLGNPVASHCFLMFSLSNSHTFGVLILHDFARNSMWVTHKSCSYQATKSHKGYEYGFRIG